MSHAARIDYEALSLTARATCEEAQRQLCKMDSLLERIHNTSSNLLTKRVKEYEKYLMKERDNLKKNIDILIEQSKQSNRDENIVDKAKILKTQVNDLITSRLLMMESVINEELIKTIKQVEKEKKNQRDGLINISKENIDKLSKVNDFALREQVYNLLLKNKQESFTTLLDQAKEMIKQKNKEIIIKNQKVLLNDVKSDMKQAGVSNEIIEKVTEKSIDSVEEYKKIKNEASNEIIGEKVRKETLKIISKTIRKRGFIIDKKNIKIDRKKNEVKLLAKKASGEKAEFRIYLDGKFIYKFDGYEGQACQKDLQPFMEDLSEIYDVNVLNKTEIWSNPDKISTMKYQTMNTNKNSN